MSGSFKIGWADRLRGLLTGRVRSVHAIGDPVVYRLSYGGAAATIDDDAFGFGNGRPRWDPRGRPVLEVDVPDALRSMACPCCDQIVSIHRIHLPHRGGFSLWMQLKRIAETIDAREAAP
ncbi:MAG TPA: hypothetical protein VF167_01875 [Longimicrobiaceae bacterium]